MRMKYYESLAIEHKESMQTKLICLLLVFATVVASAMTPFLYTHQPLDKSWTNLISANSHLNYLPKNQAFTEIENSGSDRFVLEPVRKLAQLHRDDDSRKSSACDRLSTGWRTNLCHPIIKRFLITR